MLAISKIESQFWGESFKDLHPQNSNFAATIGVRLCWSSLTTASNPRHRALPGATGWRLALLRCNVLRGR